MEPRVPDGGLSDVIVGAPVTENPPARVALAPPGLVTVTSRGPVVAVADTVIRAVSWVALFRFTEFTVIPEPKLTVPPLPEKPAAKFEPVITIAWFEAPCTCEFGLTEVTVTHYSGKFGEMWRADWERFIPFFAFPDAIRRIVYTTNSIEAVNRQLRKIIKTRGHFPTEDAALNCCGSR